jgi:hypothetical protein
VVLFFEANWSDFLLAVKGHSEPIGSRVIVLLRVLNGFLARACRWRDLKGSTNRLDDWSRLQGVVFGCLQILNSFTDDCILVSDSILSWYVPKSTLRLSVSVVKPL